MQSAKLLPGRKLVYFSSRMVFCWTPVHATRAPARQAETDYRRGPAIGVWSFTPSMRGARFPDNSTPRTNVAFDKTEPFESTSLREGPAMQDALNALAGDTGGRALRNQNYF